MAGPQHPRRTYWPTEGWQRATLQEQGIDPLLMEQAARYARGGLPALNSLLVVRNGYLVFEETGWSSGGFPEDAGYGYRWWVTNETGHSAYFAAGYGGQYLYVVPALDLIVVTTAKWQLPPEKTLDRDLITRYVLPAVR
jgi:CubicO group peptidase (beta-lactamase class C family)